MNGGSGIGEVGERIPLEGELRNFLGRGFEEGTVQAVVNPGTQVTRRECEESTLDWSH
jgi:hypothetical protein